MHAGMTVWRQGEILDHYFLPGTLVKQRRCHEVASFGGPIVRVVTPAMPQIGRRSEDRQIPFFLHFEVGTVVKNVTLKPRRLFALMCPDHTTDHSGVPHESGPFACEYVRSSANQSLNNIESMLDFDSKAAGIESVARDLLSKE